MENTGDGKCGGNTMYNGEEKPYIGATYFPYSQVQLLVLRVRRVPQTCVFTIFVFLPKEGLAGRAPAILLLYDTAYINVISEGCRLKINSRYHCHTEKS